MKEVRPTGLISDGIALMQKGHLTSASAIFNKAIALNEYPLCAHLLDAICEILSISESTSDELSSVILGGSIHKVDRVLAKMRDKLDDIEAELEASKSEI